ncbi:MAG: hypothetical protein HY921_02925 [Elusimicrobia bacterium]|nr:hypothetical protein [Elusimicrobiota bacterium]
MIKVILIGISYFWAVNSHAENVCKSMHPDKYDAACNKLFERYDGPWWKSLGHSSVDFTLIRTEKQNDGQILYKISGTVPEDLGYAGAPADKRFVKELAKSVDCNLFMSGYSKRCTDHNGANWAMRSEKISSIMRKYGIRINPYSRELHIKNWVGNLGHPKYVSLSLVGDKTDSMRIVIANRDHYVELGEEVKAACAFEIVEIDNGDVHYGDNWKKCVSKIEN